MGRRAGEGQDGPQGGRNKEVTRTGPGVPGNGGDAVGSQLAVAGLVLVCSRSVLGVGAFFSTGPLVPASSAVHKMTHGSHKGRELGGFLVGLKDYVMGFSLLCTHLHGGRGGVGGLSLRLLL